MKLSELKELAGKASPGPWDREPKNSNYPSSVVIDTSRLIVARCESKADIAYIAAANPKTVLELIERIEGLSEALRFYASPSSWTSNDDECHFIKVTDPDWDKSEWSGNFSGGKISREAISQFGPAVELTK